MVAVSKAAAEEGKLIEAGWLSFLAIAYPKGVGDVQKAEMRAIFFAGAQHLWGSIMTVLDPGAEPTEADTRRFDLIQHELDAFLQAYKQQHGISDDAIEPEEGAPN